MTKTGWSKNGDRCICIDRGHSRPMSSFLCPLTTIAWRHKALCTRTAEAARPIKMTSRFCMRWTYRGRLSGLIGSKLDIDFRRVRRKCCSYQKHVCLYVRNKFLWRNWLRRIVVHADCLDYTVLRSRHDAMVSALAFCYSFIPWPEDQISLIKFLLDLFIQTKLEIGRS